MSTYPTLNGLTLLDPGVLYPQSVEQNLPLDFWGRANSYVCPRGKEPGQAWVLMTRAMFNRLSQTSFVPLVFRSPQSNVTISDLRFVRATCMSAGPTTTDVTAAYLVELADKRRWLALSTAVKQYNVRAAAPPATSGASLYHSESLDSGAVWTWQTMLSDLWGLLPSSLSGTAPTLPYTPDGTPDGFKFLGVSAWDAIHQLLERIGCTTVYNPATDAFSLVRTGTTQSGLSAALAKLITRKLDDLSPLEHASSFLPATIRVLFHKLYKHYGSEPLTHRTGNWSQDPVYAENVATSIASAVAGTILPLWDDLPAIVNASGTVTNTGELATRAVEVAGNYVNAVSKRADHGHIVYGGAVTTISTGSEVERIVWRDYGDQMGMVTEIINRPLAFPMNGHGGIQGPSLHLNSPDLSRASFPVYPRDVHLVMVYKVSGSDGDPVSPVGDGLFPGKVLRVDVDQDTETDAPYTEGEDCYLLSMNNLTGSAGSSPTLPKGERFLGRIVGSKLVGATTYPVYAVHKDGEGEAGSLRHDWGYMFTDVDQTTVSGEKIITYANGITSDEESVVTFDAATGKFTIAEDGYVKFVFSARIVADTGYGAGTMDLWRMIMQSDVGGDRYSVFHRIDMNYTGDGTFAPTHYLIWSTTHWLPAGSVEAWIKMQNFTTTARQANIIRSDFWVDWYNQPAP